jgi:TRAP-type uncharacterized transport system substrate-binding protein
MVARPNLSQESRFLRRLLNRLGWRGMGAFLLSLVGLAFVVVGILAFAQGFQAKNRKLRITSGTDVEVREKMVQFLIRKAPEQHLSFDGVKSQGSLDALRKVENGEADLALVQAGLHLDPDTPIREVASIDLERLHLLVRAEHAAAITADLRTLRGKTVFLNFPQSGTYFLSRLVLARVGLKPVSQGTKLASDGVILSPLNSHEIIALLNAMQKADHARRQQLQLQFPDACFLVASLPSRLALRLINEADYRLVPLPFARALAMISIEEATNDSDQIDQLNIEPTDIPEFTYSISPPVPASSCPTLGVRTLLVAHKDVPDDAIQRILPVLYEGTIPSLYRPPELQTVVPEYPFHPGTIRYRDRNKPIVRSEVVDVFRTIFSVAGPVLGLILTLYGYFRWRQLLRFTRYFRQILHLDLVARGLRTDNNLPKNEEERLRYLDGKLTHLKRQAITDFCDNYFRGEAIVHNLLALLTETGQHIRDAAVPQSSKEPAPVAPTSDSGTA